VKDSTKLEVTSRRRNQSKRTREYPVSINIMKSLRRFHNVILQSKSSTGVPNLSLTIYPLSITPSTDEHVSLKFLMTKRLSKIPKKHWIFSTTSRFF